MLRRASFAIGVLAFAAPCLTGNAVAARTIRGRVSGLYRVSFTALGVHDSSYARIWTATPECATGDCAFTVRARDAGARTSPSRFVFHYDGDIYDLTSHGPEACEIVKDANTKKPRRSTVAGAYTVSTDLRIRVSKVSHSGRATNLRGTFVFRETPTARGRADGCTSTYVHRYRVTGHAQA
jgi:hypothetical protein